MSYSVLKALHAFHPHTIHLQPQSIPQEDLLPNQLCFFKDEDQDWHYQINILGQLYTGLLDEQLDAKVIFCLDGLYGRSCFGDITQEDMGYLTDITRCYWKLPLAIQLKIKQFFDGEIRSDMPLPQQYQVCCEWLHPQEVVLREGLNLSHAALQKWQSIMETPHVSRQALEQFKQVILQQRQKELEKALGYDDVTTSEIETVLNFNQNTVDEAISMIKAKHCYLLSKPQDMPQKSAPSTIYVWYDETLEVWYYRYNVLGDDKQDSFDKVQDKKIYSALNAIKRQKSQGHIAQDLGILLLNEMSEAYLGLTLFEQTRLFTRLKAIWPFAGSLWTKQQVVDICLAILSAKPIANIPFHDVFERFRCLTFPAFLQLFEGSWQHHTLFKIHWLFRGIITVIANENGYHGKALPLLNEDLFCKHDMVIPLFYRQLYQKRGETEAASFLTYYAHGPQALSIAELLQIIELLTDQSLTNLDELAEDVLFKEFFQESPQTILQPQPLQECIHHVILHLGDRLTEMNMEQTIEYDYWLYAREMSLYQVLRSLRKENKESVIKLVGPNSIYLMRDHYALCDVLQVLDHDEKLLDILLRHIPKKELTKQFFTSIPACCDVLRAAHKALHPVLLAKIFSQDCPVATCIENVIDLLNDHVTNDNAYSMTEATFEERRLMVLRAALPCFHWFTQGYTDIYHLLENLNANERQVCLVELANVFCDVYNHHMEFQMILCLLSEEECKLFILHTARILPRVINAIQTSAPHLRLNHPNIQLLMQSQHEPLCFLQLSNENEKRMVIKQAADTYLEHARLKSIQKSAISTDKEKVSFFRKTPMVRSIIKIQKDLSEQVSYDALFVVVQT